MSAVHIHLLVNHAPIFGAFFALALIVASFFYAPEVLRRTALVVLIGTALAAGAADLSGDPAARAVRGLPGVRREVIHNHDEMAGDAFTAAAIVGVLALGALVKWRRAPLPRSVAYASLMLAAIVSGMMAYTGLLGGQIRHTEVRPGATAADAMLIEPPRVRASGALPGAPAGKPR